MKGVSRRGFSILLAAVLAAGIAVSGERPRALETAASLPIERRPVVFGIEPASSREKSREFVELSGSRFTRARSDVWEFRRSEPFGFRDALSYQIVANWAIAEHKSQGLFQMDAGRHDLERFWRFEASVSGSQEAADQLFERGGPTRGNAAAQGVGSHP
jgi:hypothetical protein